MSNREWKLVAFGSISHCEFCENQPVTYLMISDMDGHVQHSVIFLCDECKTKTIHNVIHHNVVTNENLKEAA